MHIRLHALLLADI